MSYADLALNQGAAKLVAKLQRRAAETRIHAEQIGGALVIDCGVQAPGSLRAGCLLARVCMAGWGRVQVPLDRLGARPCPKVTVQLDEPAVGCLLAQYAGWQIAVGKFFAMGSGPLRAIAAKEPIFAQLGYQEAADVAVGVLETGRLPDAAVIEYLTSNLKLPPERLLLLAARTASLAGSLQVVARSVETCLHKLHEVGFDVRQVRSALGAAFLPPIPKDDLTAIGRTNDSILYGGEVCLWVDAADADLERVGPQVPASASKDYGEPFASIFKRYGGDFYQIDPLLFSPALVTINNLRTGRTFSFGKTDFPIVERSFFG